MNTPPEFAYTTDSKTLEVARELFPDNKSIDCNRIIEKDTVSIVGLPEEICKEEVLTRNEYLGQYGTIKLINTRLNACKKGKRKEDFLNFAYIRFASFAEAFVAILAIESKWKEQYPEIAATIGTTKFCKKLLKTGCCMNKMCCFFHEEPSPELICFVKQNPLAYDVIKHQQDNAFAIILKDASKLMEHTYPTIDKDVEPVFPSVNSGIEF